MEISKEGFTRIPAITLSQKTGVPSKPPDPYSSMLRERHTSQEHNDKLDEMNEDLVSQVEEPLLMGLEE